MGDDTRSCGGVFRNMVYSTANVADCRTGYSVGTVDAAGSYTASTSCPASCTLTEAVAGDDGTFASRETCVPSVYTDHTTDCSFDEGDPSSCGAGCTYTANAAVGERCAATADSLAAIAADGSGDYQGCYVDDPSNSFAMLRDVGDFAMDGAAPDRPFAVAVVRSASLLGAQVPSPSRSGSRTTTARTRRSRAPGRRCSAWQDNIATRRTPMIASRRRSGSASAATPTPLSSGATAPSFASSCGTTSARWCRPIWRWARRIRQTAPAGS